ncbi:DUF1015 family protein [Streptomyces sp. PSAA01]|uniref:DUF1015 family protein n=1 Tax=Streptomyces sp. PSAA01 TaxID=2912762 RepID=UPI001F1702CE|nr:DUF1015 domain-containing protein [Streptomyces sp. PSAA01]MCG0290789.1 DUF1015 domain-containing protein [Streptomyces sp. PSAA01]
MSIPGPGGQGLQLTPFRGLRYVAERVGSLAAVTSPPYDVVVRPDGLRELETADPYNIVRLILPQADSPEARHRQAAETLRRWQADGVLAPDPEPALYVYEQRDGRTLQRGLIGALRLSPREEGIVLPHEEVMPHVVEDRAALMRATAAHLEPLLLAYRGNGHGNGTSGNGATGPGTDEPGTGGVGTGGAARVIESAIQREPLLSTTTEDGVDHHLWRVTGPADLVAVAADLRHHQALIADGHHRWATYLRLREERSEPGPWDFGLVLLVDTARYPLRVRAIHRLLRQLSPDDALTAARHAFRVRTIDGPLPRALETLAEAAQAAQAAQAARAEPGAPNAFLLAGDSRFHLLDRPDPELLTRTVPEGRPEAWRTLDATVLHHALLDHLWNVPDTPEHIGYIHDSAAAVEQAERLGGTAVLMHAVVEDVVHELARQGIAMPHKSTSFGPKPATGLVLRSLTLG